MSMIKTSISPAKAQELLGTSPANRTILARNVVSFADAMRRDEWALVGMLVLDDKGRLRDGHHRLRAVVEADKTVDFYVLRGVPERDLDKIDTGKVRTLSDRLRILRPGVTNAPLRAAVTTVCARLLTNNHVVINSLDDYDRWHGLFSSGTDWIMRLRQNHHGPVTVSPVLGALAFARRAAPSETEAFGEKLLHQTGMIRGEAAWLLYRNLVEGRRDRGSWATSRRVLRAVLADVRKESLTKIADGVEGLAYFRAAYRGADVEAILAPWRALGSQEWGVEAATGTALVLEILAGGPKNARGIGAAAGDRASVQAIRGAIGRLVRSGQIEATARSGQNGRLYSVVAGHKGGRPVRS